MTNERSRLEENHRREKNWQRWGPYLSDRQWATVREDYSPHGDVWEYFPFSDAASRVYRWGEDGLLGITDRECRLCFALSLWNEKDPILKERLFGLTETQGNHGEDVKEHYFYLESTPTHSYMKALYKYPHAAYPYQQLLDENRKRTLKDPEYEIDETGVFNECRYFDVFVEYAKKSPDDLLIKITVINRGPEKAPLHVLPTLWFRNTWDWKKATMPNLEMSGEGKIKATHETLGPFILSFEKGSFEPPLFTNNSTNFAKLYNGTNLTPYVKDAFNDYVIHGIKTAVNPKFNGTKCAPHYVLMLEGGETKEIRLRLTAENEVTLEPFGAEFEEIFKDRKRESDDFYKEVIPARLTDQEKLVSRQAYAGLLWNKQFYHFIVKDWLNGDPLQPPPSPERLHGRNRDWLHVYMNDVISMPDKWEYPWFASWDLAFHMIPFAKIDPDFAKAQLRLFLREWYMHPNGELPAYEFAFSDVNPPVHAWSAWRVYKMTGEKGSRDRLFLEGVFHKLLLNFTWWVNRKDIEGNNLFSGGFLGLDNIGVFNRSRELPMGGHLQQADGTAWMAFYCLTMLLIALELAPDNPVYEDLASKFFEHFIAIADAINDFGGTGLWNEEDGFYYDQLKITGGNSIPLRTRSMVGLIPLIAAGNLEIAQIEKLPGFSKRMHWFLNNRKDLKNVISFCESKVNKEYHLLAIPSKTRLKRILRYLLDENEFLSPYGIRSLSKVHGDHPYVLNVDGKEHRVDYVPGVSNSWLFGGNSNWRGPIWLPINFLIIEALERYDRYYGSDFTVEFPYGSGKMMTLKEVASEISKRICSLFHPKEENEGDEKRACHGNASIFKDDPYSRDLLLFHEYFHGETGEGLGANHQTGWTALVTKLLEMELK